MKRSAIITLLATLTLTLMACGLQNTPPVPVSSPTSTITPALPTATSRPTTTSTPTQTPLPSATPPCPPRPDLDAKLESVQERTAALVPGAQVIWHDNFNCQDLGAYGWGLPNGDPEFKTTVSDHVLTMHTREVEGNWSGVYWNAMRVKDNQGVLLRFRYEAGTVAGLFIETGGWQSADFRRWSISILNSDPFSSWDRWRGRNETSYNIHSGLLRPGKWYYLLMQLGSQGEITMRVWEMENPGNDAEFQKMADPDLAGHQWTFAVQVYTGTVEIAEFEELSFDTP